jgi:hypothetical protein
MMRPFMKILSPGTTGGDEQRFRWEAVYCLREFQQE